MGGICIICLRKREGKVRENLHKASTSPACLIKRIQTTTKPQTTSKPHTTSHHSTRHQYASKTSIPFTREDPKTSAAADPAEPPPSSTQRTPAAENNPHKLPRREEHSRVESRRGERKGWRPTSRASVWNPESRSFPFQGAFDKTKKKRGRTLEIPETVVYERL